MSQYFDSSARPFVAGGAIDQHLRVKLSGGKLVVAGLGATDENVELGTMTEASFQDGDLRAVRLRNAPGTCPMVAAKAIDAGDLVYGAAGGKVSDAASGGVLGQAMDSSAADGDVIEVLRYATVAA